MLSKNRFFSNNLIERSKKASILEKEEEFYLINDWRDNKTPKSLQKILNSYLLYILTTKAVNEEVIESINT